MRQYAHLAWLFESPFPRYFKDRWYGGKSFASMQKVQDNLVEKGLVKIVKYDNFQYNYCLEEYKKGNDTKEELQEWKEYCYHNVDKVWAYRQWMTHEEYASRNLKELREELNTFFCRYQFQTPFPLPASLVSFEDRSHDHWNMAHECEYPSLTEDGVVAVLRKFGLRSDSKLEVSAPEPKWRVEWKENK
jgi:hypothetical protein